MTRTIRYAEAVREALAEELERDDAVFLMGQDVATFGGVFGATAGLQDQFGPNRVFDTPISETFLVGGGVGAAITGLRPVVELQFADFIWIAGDEMTSKAAKWRYMHGGLFSVPLVVRLPEGAVGGAGPEHSQSPEAALLPATGIYIAVPSTPADAKGLLKSAIRDNNPVAFFEHKGLYTTQGEVPDESEAIPLGQADIKRRGTDVTVIAWGRMVHRAQQAAELAAADGVDVEVLDPRGLRPLDVPAILRSVEKTGRVLLTHEAGPTGGGSAEVAATIAEQAITSLEAPIRRMCGVDTPVPQSVHLEQYLVPSAEELRVGIKELVE